MLTNQEILEAVIAKAHNADEATLILMLEAKPRKSEEIRLSTKDMAAIESSRQRRINGEKGSSLEEIVTRMSTSRTSGGL